MIFGVIFAVNLSKSSCKMKRIILLSFLTLYFSLNIFSQELVISGTVYEKNSREAVPFANIGISGQSIGTVTNERGEYEFHLPSKYQSDTLTVSCIGYFNYKTPIKDALQKETFNIFLKSRTYELETFTIRAKEPSALEIVQKAIENIPKNYLVQPALMDGFYREYFKENGRYVAFAEAAVNIYDAEGYATNRKNKTREIISIEELRVSDILNQGEYVLYIDLNYALRGNMLRNVDFWEKYADRAKIQLEDIKVDSISYFGDDLVWCISYDMASKKTGNYSGRLFVRKVDYAVLRFEITSHNSLKGREINGAPHKSSAVLVYKEHKGKLYLNYINANHDVAYVVNERPYRLNFYSELIINDIQARNVKPIPSTNKIEDISIFYQPRYRTFDPDYWATYNLFENSPANKVIIRDLEKDRDLDTQYKANGKLKIQSNRYKNFSGYNRGFGGSSRGNK